MSNSRMIRVSSKGQIVLPKSLRERLGIQNGDFIYIEEIDGILLLEKPAPGKLAILTEQLRKKAREQGFTRTDLETAIQDVRSQSEG